MTDITWPDKVTGDEFTADEANEVKDAVNSKSDEDHIHTIGDISNADTTTAASYYATALGAMSDSNKDTFVASIFPDVNAGEALVRNEDGSFGGVATAVSGGISFTSPTTTVGAKLGLSEGTNGGTNEAILQAPATLSATVNLTLPSSSGTIALTSDIGVGIPYTAASASGPATLDFAEDTDNGSNKATITAPSSLGSDITLTLPTSSGTFALTSDIGASVPFTAASAGGPASMDYAEQTTNGTNKITLSAPASIASDVTLTLPATTDTLVGKTTTDTLTNKTLTSPTLTTPVLGTPSSGTLTNCTGLPVAGITASTSTALGVGSVELGHASDTTLSRSSAGVLAVEGVTVSLNSTSATHTAGTIELGAASDTTLSRASAGVLAVEGVNVLLNGGALGTPSSGTLTNATGLPVSGITASTSTALGVGSVELGHASDTTLSRSSAGVLAVEGVTVSLNSTSATHTAGTIELGAASDTTIARDSAGIISVEGAKIQLAGTTDVYVDASAFISPTTSGAEPISVEMATNKQQLTGFAFDTAADEYIQFKLQLPKRYNNGTMTARMHWAHPSTTTNFSVLWAIQGLATSDDDAIDAAWGTAVTSQGEGGTTYDKYLSAATSAMTLAGSPASGDMLWFRVYRDTDGNGTATNDDLAVDAYLLGVTLTITTNAATDA